MLFTIIIQIVIQTTNSIWIVNQSSVQQFFELSIIVEGDAVISIDISIEDVVPELLVVV